MIKAETILQGGIDLYNDHASIKCEIDGEPLAGVRYVTIEVDRDGDHCIMIFTEPTLAYHFSGVTWPEPFDALASESSPISKNNKDDDGAGT